MISQQFARQFFPGRDPLGATIQVGGRSHRVVGIAQDSVVNEIGEPPQPYLYLPFGQGAYGETTFILETAGDADAIAAAARATLRQVDARLEPRRMVTMAQYIAYATSMHRTTAALATILGLVGLVLTAVGVYGVVACRTNRRTKEIGIRMALGAASAEVIGLVMRDGLRLGALGIVVGLPLALGSTWLVASMLVGVRPWDVVSFAAAAAILLAAIAIATFLPARRAMRIQPAQALR